LADNIQILIAALLEKSSTAQIKKDIDELQKYCNDKKLKLTLDIDNSEFKLFSERLGKLSTDITKSLNIKPIIKPVLDTKDFDEAKGKLLSQEKYSVLPIGGSEKNLEVINKYRDATEKLITERNILDQVTNEAGVTEDKTVKVYTRSKDEIEKNEIAVKKLTQSIELYKQKMLGGNGFAGEIDIFASKNKNNFDPVALDKVRASVQGLNIDTPDATNNMKQLGNEFSSLKLQAAQSGNIITKMFENMVKFLRFYVVGGFLVSGINVIKGGVQSVVDLDTALTSLSKVADLTSAQLKNVTDRAFEAGTAVGRTGKEVIDATAEWSRAGYNVEESFKLAQQSLLFTNVADGIDNVTEASSSLIAIMKGYKMEVGSVAHVIDSLNEVSNKYAVNTNDLTEVMKRASGTLAQTGTSYEQLLGLATGGIETLRNSEIVASGLNTISQRLRGMQEDGTAAAEIIPKIQAAFDKYTNGTVSVIDKQNGGLNSTYEILKQLSTIYPTLSDEAKAYLNEQISGNRQNKVLVAIMDNWKNVETTINDATNSLGSADKSNSKFLASIQGKTNQFSSSMQKLWKNAIESDFIKFIVEAGTAIVKIIDSLGTLNVVIMVTTVVLLLLNKGFLTFYSANFASMFLGMATVLELKLLPALGMTAGAAASVGKAFAMIAPFAIIAGIMLLVAGLDYVSKAAERQTEEIRKLKEGYDTLTTSLDDNIAKQQTVKDKLKELYEIRTNNGLTDAEKSLLTNLENQSIELKRQIDYETALKAIRGAELERKTIEQSKSKSELGTQEGANYSNQPIYNAEGYAPLTKSEKTQQDKVVIDQTTKQMKDLDIQLKNGKISVIEYGKEYDKLTQIRTVAVNSMNAMITKLQDENKGLVGNSAEGNKLKASNEATIIILQNIIMKLNNKTVATDDAGTATEKLANAQRLEAEAQAKTTAETLAAQDAYEKYGTTIQTLTTFLTELSATGGGKLSDESLKLLISKYPELLKYKNDDVKLQTEINKLLNAEQNKAATDAYVTQTNKLKELYAIQLSLNKEGKLSADDTQKIIENYDTLIPYLNDEKRLKEEMIKLIGTEENAQREAFRYKLELSESYFNTQIKGNADLVNALATAYGTDAKNFKTISDAKGQTDLFLRQYVSAGWKELYGNEITGLQVYLSAAKQIQDRQTFEKRMGMSSGYTSPDTSALTASAQAQYDALTKVQSAMDVSIKKLDLSGLTKSAIAAGATTDAIKTFLATLQDIDAITEYAHQLNQLSQQMAEATGDTNALIKAKIEEQNIYKNLNAVYQSNIDKIREQMTHYKSTSQEYKDLEDALRKYTTSIEDNKIAIITLDKALEEHDKELRDKTIETQNLILDAVKNRIKKQYDLESKALDDKIALLNREKQILTDNYNDSKKAKDDADLQTQLNKKESELMRISRDNSGLYEKDKLALTDEVAKLRDQIHQNSLDSEVTAQQKAIDDQVTAVEKQKQDLTDQYNLMEADYRTYWAEVTNILNGSQTSILDFLKNNTDAYKNAGQAQKDAYLAGWGDTLDMFKGIQSGAEKTSGTIKSEVGNSTGTSPGGTPSTGGSPTGGDSSAPAFSGSNLKVGSKGSAVVAIQQKLGITADGIFGSKTLAAVKAFQKSHGLSADGIVGKDTWAGLFGTSGTINLPASGKGVSSSTPYSNIINEAAIKYGLDPAILAGLIKTESGFDPNARSTAGAVGLTQLMPSTAKELGVTNRNDPYQSIMGGAKYLSQQIKKFNSVELGIRAYFWGPGNVSAGKGNSTYQNTVLSNAKRYKEGGLVDYTGFALVDGTKTKPESFLNSDQTMLIQNLLKGLTAIPAFKYSNPKIPAFSGGGNNITFENKIIVESGVVDNDYDANRLGQQIGNGINKFFEDAQRKSGLTFTVSKP